MKRQLQMMALATLALAGAQAHAVCTFGSSSEPSLQSSFDSLLGAGTLNATTAGSRGWSHQLISTGAFGFYLSTRSNGTFFSETGLRGTGAGHNTGATAHTHGHADVRADRLAGVSRRAA